MGIWLTWAIWLSLASVVSALIWLPIEVGQRGLSSAKSDFVACLRAMCAVLLLPWYLVRGNRTAAKAQVKHWTHSYEVNSPFRFCLTAVKWLSTASIAIAPAVIIEALISKLV
jgi:hypothetical protein